MQLNKKVLAVAVAAVLPFAPEVALAASQVPETVLTTLTTDITDTFEDVNAWVWGIFPIIAIGWFAFNQTRKGAGKFGAK